MEKKKKVECTKARRPKKSPMKLERKKNKKKLGKQIKTIQNRGMFFPIGRYTAEQKKWEKELKVSKSGQELKRKKMGD